MKESFPSNIFVSAFKHSGIGMALLRLDGRWIDVNHAVCRMTEYSREELLEMTFQQITYPDDLALDLNNLSKLSRNEVGNYTVEKRYVTKSRKVLWVSVTVTLVRENDKPHFFISQIVDIDKKIELSRELDVKVNELELARQILDEKIKQLEHLNYTLAHNLRGPLRNFQIISQALLSQRDKTAEPNDLTGALSEEEGIQMLAQGSKSLADDLDKLLILTSIKQNPELQVEDCDLALLIDNILAQHSAEIFEKDAELVFNYNLRYFRTSKVYLTSILYNLISNAVKYTEPSRRPRIEVSSGKENDHQFIEVSDNGIGINLAKYGNRLFQMNQTFHDGYDSKGVGLFLAKAQAESIGATLTVQSEPSVGSIFKILLHSVRETEDVH